MQLGTFAQAVTAKELRSRDGLTLGDFLADFRLGQQHPVGVVLDRTVVGLAGVAVIAVTVFQDQVTVAIGVDLLVALFRDQYRRSAILGLVLTEAFLGNEHAAQVDPVFRQFFGVGHP
ncbi:hypothetical protein D3C77_254680 [compost metagenome]